MPLTYEHYLSVCASRVCSWFGHFTLHFPLPVLSPLAVGVRRPDHLQLYGERDRPVRVGDLQNPHAHRCPLQGEQGRLYSGPTLVQGEWWLLS